MNELPSAISVIRTRLPYLDRGALSRAWCEALGLAGSRSNVSQAALRRQLDAAPPATARFSVGPAAAPSRTVTPLPTAFAARRAASPELFAAAGKPRARSRRPVEVAPTAARRAPRAAVSQLTLTFAGGRVQLVIRRRGDRLDLVALCAAHRVEAVRRALAGVELELRGARVVTVSHVAALGSV